MKLLLPSTLNSIFARILALTLGMLLLSIAALAALMQTSLSDKVSNRVILESAQSIAELVWLLETSPPEVEGAILSTYAGLSQVARITPHFPPNMKSDAGRLTLLVSDNSAVTERLRGRKIMFRKLGLIELRQLSKKEPLRPFYAMSAVQIAIQLADKSVLTIWLAPSIFYANGPTAWLFLSGLFSILTIGLGLAIHWVIMRPIRALEHDAEIVGLAETSIAVSETGPLELRRLSKALNLMRARLAQLVREREQIMIAIAHDIRTGLTKIRLRMDANEAVSRDLIEPDLAQMEHLLADMMAYARAENPVTGHELVEVCEFVSSLGKAAPYSVSVDIDRGRDGFVIAGNKVALRRLFENLLENARRYGSGLVMIHIKNTGKGLYIDILDDGPGIPPEEMNRIFDPFVRLEGSRNPALGGTGLGLGIARAIAHTHGGEITLSNRPEGGLCAQTFFPKEIAT
jgi:signal transduction histidine kinase